MQVKVQVSHVGEFGQTLFLDIIEGLRDRIIADGLYTPDELTAFVDYENHPLLMYTIMAILPASLLQLKAGIMPHTTTDEGKIHFISPQLLKKLDYQTPIGKFFASATYMSRRTEAESLDFTLGDAHELPPSGFVEALQRWSVPQNSSWYGYKGNIPESQVTVSAALQDKRGLSILPEDIFMTNGTVVGLAICLQMLAGFGDEVIILTPPWFGYRTHLGSK